MNLWLVSQNVRLRALVVICGGAILVGCRSNKPLATAEVRAEVERNSFWQPHLLLTSDARYRKLEVEIDHVEGFGPTAAELKSLKEFIEAQCRKPDGVTLRVDQAIPRREAKGKSHKALAELHLDGPQGSNSAFVYFLFYDGRLAGTPRRNPETSRRPFPGAVFINRRFMRQYSWFPGARDMERRMVLHEAGHVLGLCGHLAHGDGIHCTNRHCLMNWSLEIRPLYLLLPGPVMPQREFCSECQADLAAARAQRPADNLHYLGPYCVRSEIDYHVLTSPGFVYVSAGRLEDIDLAELQRKRRTYFEDNPKPDGVYFHAHLPDEATARQLLPSLERDPLEIVRTLGEKLRDQLK